MIAESLKVLDSITLNFSQGGLLFMNITLAFIMFGVALEIDLESFKKIINKPKSAIVGVISQFFLLPIVTFLFVTILQPSPAVALGMILVAACPGGNISNFVSSLGKGNIALSVSLTAIATLAAIFMTPFNFAFWGKLYAKSHPLLRPIEIDPIQMFQTVFILLGIPLIFGMIFSRKFPETTKKILKPIKIFSILIFMGFVVVALASNFSYFLRYIHLIVIIVFIQNGLGLLSGYYFSKVLKLPEIDQRTISIETGIQNSGLALVLIFNPKIFPSDLQLGGMAFIAAWWGIWHIISGLGLAYYWHKRPPIN
ncbi:MAG: symporter [Bacteroidetes bacterium GWC2_33_15]|nr:MAG: symporter [Bacteroidetes bacterium GWA2_33_15]OFX51885.1 MAG: symporter [Bacteroidetes bacterium GWC2_33_15]OFX63453.1 MAG: symporter [Bacteroidetes bacterium GWB2_32_14]OFX67198.1 MAG: symporter [Bacteroidetes bacterium GWD2_33_33]HAN17077.1 symporter [Bacteroidales bacterium]